MPNNYLQFSEELTNITADEKAWLEKYLQYVEVPEVEEDTPGDEVARLADTLPHDALEDGETTIPRFLLLAWPPANWENFFEYHGGSFDEWRWDGDDTLWFNADEAGDIELVAELVKVFLARWRPNDCWSLTYCTLCSKPRIGEFSGGGVFVTAAGIEWMNAYGWIDEKKKAFDDAKGKA